MLEIACRQVKKSLFDYSPYFECHLAFDDHQIRSSILNSHAK
jgi:hypothetical protein